MVPRISREIYSSFLRSESNLSELIKHTHLSLVKLFHWKSVIKPTTHFHRASYRQSNVFCVCARFGDDRVGEKA